MISVITAVFNRADAIERTLDSVYRQRDSVREHIIIDGASTDGTKEKVEAFIAEKKASYIKFTSETDEGIYHALNKGISKAEGEIIGLLHVGDIFMEGALRKIVDLISQTQNNKETIFAASAQITDDETTTVYLRSEKPPLSYTNPKIKHPAIFVPAHLYKHLGVYEKKFKISADFEFIARHLSNSGQIVYSDLVVTEMEPFNMARKYWLRKTYEQFLIQFKYAGPLEALRNIIWAKRMQIIKGCLRWPVKKLAIKRTPTH